MSKKTKVKERIPRYVVEEGEGVAKREEVCEKPRQKQNSTDTQKKRSDTKESAPPKKEQCGSCVKTSHGELVQLPCCHVFCDSCLLTKLKQSCLGSPKSTVFDCPSESEVCDWKHQAPQKFTIQEMHKFFAPVTNSMATLSTKVVSMTKRKGKELSSMSVAGLAVSSTAGVILLTYTNSGYIWIYDIPCEQHKSVASPSSRVCVHGITDPCCGLVILSASTDAICVAIAGSCFKGERKINRNLFIITLNQTKGHCAQAAGSEWNLQINKQIDLNYIPGHISCGSDQMGDYIILLDLQKKVLHMHDISRCDEKKDVSLPHNLQKPTSLVMNKEGIAVLDEAVHQVYFMDNRQKSKIWYHGSGQMALIHPVWVADSGDGCVLVVDRDSHCVLKIDMNSKNARPLLTKDDGIPHPHLACVSNDGQLYVLHRRGNWDFIVRMKHVDM